MERLRHTPLLLLWLMAVLQVVAAQQPPSSCRNCSIGDCLPVPRAEGGCDACICNGLLMPVCEALNCSANCAEQPTPDGCFECVCTEVAPNVCPPIPACPSRCQVQLGSGCPRCTCPDEVPPQCPAVTCPQTCTDIIGPDGCPACECPPEDKICPQMPACPLGCIDESNDPQHVGCLSCNCTIIEELLEENQIIPVDIAEEIPDELFDAELVSSDDLIDSGLIIATEVFNTDITERANDLPTTVFASKTPVAESLPPTTIPTDIIVAEESHGNLPPNTAMINSDLVNSLLTTVPEMTIPTVSPIGPNALSAPNQLNQQHLRPFTQENRRTNPGSRRPPLNIPCGETSCPPGCTLCLQNNNCGRCLCGDNARVCPPVPACQHSCITSGRDGCFRCSCPSPGNFLPNIPELHPGPVVFRPGFALESAEDFIPRPGHGRPPYVTFVRGPPRGPAVVGPEGPLRGHVGPAGPIRDPSLGHWMGSPARLAIERIPAHLLGQSRFHFRT